MATWKKVIVSGSSADLTSLTLDTALAVAEAAGVTAREAQEAAGFVAWCTDEGKGSLEDWTTTSSCTRSGSERSSQKLLFDRSNKNVSFQESFSTTAI